MTRGISANHTTGRVTHKAALDEATDKEITDLQLTSYTHNVCTCGSYTDW
jgi:hypothetical protein